MLCKTLCAGLMYFGDEGMNDSGHFSVLSQPCNTVVNSVVWSAA